MRGDVDTQETAPVAQRGTDGEPGMDGGAGGVEPRLPHRGRSGARNLGMMRPLDLPVTAAHQISGANVLGNHNVVSLSHEHR
ncbi:hypothetical protein GCM10010980_18800 [Corynebacterium marinum]|nr:hypothetical protein GCM10010980_18800 [Corynebacterium marinum]